MTRHIFIKFFSIMLTIMSPKPSCCLDFAWYQSKDLERERDAIVMQLNPTRKTCYMLPCQ